MNNDSIPLHRCPKPSSSHVFACNFGPDDFERTCINCGMVSRRCLLCEQWVDRKTMAIVSIKLHASIDTFSGQTCCCCAKNIETRMKGNISSSP